MWKKGRYRLLGHPDAIQGPVQRNPPGEAREGWRLLHGVDSDDSTDMSWGNDGRLCYWMEEDALDRCQFDRAWNVMQCYQRNGGSVCARAHVEDPG